MELKALVVRSKTPSWAASSVHEPRGLQPRLLLPRTALKKENPPGAQRRVSVQPVHPRQPSPGDAFNLNNAQSRRNRVCCHTECGEGWGQQGETRVPSGLQFLPKSLQKPKGSSAAQLAHRDTLGEQLCACCSARAVPAGTELVPQPGCPAVRNGSMENASWRF